MRCGEASDGDREMKPTQIYFAYVQCFSSLGGNTTELPDGRRVPWRPEGTRRSVFHRLYAAWLVFTGRADALMWLEQ